MVNRRQTLKSAIAAVLFSSRARALLPIGGSASLPQAATPTFSPAGGSYSSAQSVTISSATSSASIYYTTDGSTPTTGSTLYTGAVSVSSSETINAIAVASGYTQSAVGTAAYTISSAVQQFSFSTFVSGDSSVLTTPRNAELSPPVMIVATDDHAAGGGWYNTQQTITSFQTEFTFTIVPSTGTGLTQALTFCVQNSNTTTNPPAYGNTDGVDAASDANCAGFGGYTTNWTNDPPIYGIGNSVAVKFDIGNNSLATGTDVASTYCWPPGSLQTGSTTGIYINGGPPSALMPANDLIPYGINLFSGHLFSAFIVYDGTLLTLVLTDTVTNAQARCVWPIDKAPPRSGRR